jgi:hypothetical protein
MTVSDLQQALLPYPDRFKIIVIIEGQEEHSYSPVSVDEIRDAEIGQTFVVIACTRIPGLNNDALDSDDD